MSASHNVGGTGVYVVHFATPVDSCAGSAATALFPGADRAINGLHSFFLEIGQSQGNADPTAVSVFVQDKNDVPINSAFTLILACPVA